MQIRRVFFLALIVLAALFPFSGQARPFLYVAFSLEPSMMRALATANLTPQLVAASSGVLARQISRGAPVDCMVTAHVVWKDWLEEQGYAPIFSTVILENRLVLTEAGSEDDTEAGSEGGAGGGAGNIPALLRKARYIAIGEPEHVPAGLYAQQALLRMGLWEELQKQIIPVPHVRAGAVLALRKEVDIAILYESDAVSTEGLRIAARVPYELHDPVQYVALSYSPAGTELIRVLQSEPAQKVFHQFGFRSPAEN